MAKRYFKRRFSRAFQDTIRPLGWNRLTLIFATTGTVSTIIFYWLIAGKEAVRTELKLLLATISGFTAIFVFTFLWNYLMTPSRMQAESDQKIQKLEKILHDKSHIAGVLSKLAEVRVVGYKLCGDIATQKNLTENDRSTIRKHEKQIYDGIRILAPHLEGSYRTLGKLDSFHIPRDFSFDISLACFAQRLSMIGDFLKDYDPNKFITAQPTQSNFVSQ